MAKFKKRKVRRFSFARKARRSSTGGSNPLKVIIPAVVYGAGRKYLSDLATPLTSKIPLGNYADEALFGVLGYFMAKKGKGMIKDAGVAILTVEAASLGNQIFSGLTSTTATSGSDTVSGY